LEDDDEDLMDGTHDKIKEEETSSAEVDRAGENEKSFEMSLLRRLRESYYDLVRAAYWKQIEEGSLKKGSYSAISLLYALDIRLDHLDDDESHDFKFLEPSFEKQPHQKVHLLFTPVDYVVNFFTNAYNLITGSTLEPPVISSLVESEIDYYHDEYVISVLTNYISAHKYSQKKAPKFLGQEITDTPESQHILKESINTVKRAEEILSGLDPSVVEYHVLRQVSNRVITLQEEMINQFLQKGVLFPMDAAILVEEVADQRRSLRNEHWFLHSYRRRNSSDSVLQAIEMSPNGAVAQEE